MQRLRLNEPPPEAFEILATLHLTSRNLGYEGFFVVSTEVARCGVKVNALIIVIQTALEQLKLWHFAKQI